MPSENEICELCGYEKGKSEPGFIDTVDRNGEHVTKEVWCECTPEIMANEIAEPKERIYELEENIRYRNERRGG